MLSYLHGFHAGNFADVQKHAALTLVLRMMQVKPSAIAMFDTHAGSANYNLDDERARKTGEADSGIQAVWQSRLQLTSDDWAGLLEPLATVQSDDSGIRVKIYPGSPALMQHYLREQDQLCAWELHPSEGQSLADWASDRKSVRVIQGDGLAGLTGRLPPAQPRLLALIDPSYEVKQDYESVAATLIRAWKACRHGVFMIWYPILPSGAYRTLQEAIINSPIRKVYCHEVRLGEAPARGMQGSGLLVVNPPWGFGERLSEMLKAVSGSDCLDFLMTDSWLIDE